MFEKKKYYSLYKIQETGATYKMIIGERSNGKTYAVLRYGLLRYAKDGTQMAIVRRWSEDFTGKRGSVMFDSLVLNGEVEKITHGKWTGVYYYASKWFLCRMDDKDKRITDDRPFAYGFSISAMEHDKSTSYPAVRVVMFDEFICRAAYLPDEFVLFCNTLSTIIRDRMDVEIYMLGNTVNRYCPYFAEMGLDHVKEQKQGTIDVYRYGDSDLTVAVEYCAPQKSGKKSDRYFAFANPKLSMITGGTWEVNLYPHLPRKYVPADVLFRYYVEWDKELLQAEIVCQGWGIDDNTAVFTYIHRWTSDVPEDQLLFSRVRMPSPYRRQRINLPIDDIGKRIWQFFRERQVYYQDNTVGEVVRNYLLWCGAESDDA